MRMAKHLQLQQVFCLIKFYLHQLCFLTLTLGKSTNRCWELTITGEALQILHFGFTRSTALRSFPHPSHWSPLASSKPQRGQVPSTNLSARNLSSQTKVGKEKRKKKYHERTGHVFLILKTLKDHKTDKNIFIRLCSVKASEDLRKPSMSLKIYCGNWNYIQLALIFHIFDNTIVFQFLQIFTIHAWSLTVVKQNNKLRCNKRSEGMRVYLQEFVKERKKNFSAGASNTTLSRNILYY